MKEFRVCEVRATDPAGDSGLILEGVPVVYDRPALIKESFGQYTEVIKRGALDGADLSDVRLLYNHDLGKLPLARTPKTMQFKLDPAGLRMTAELPETPEGQGVYTAVKRGDLSGMSFAFKVPQGGSTFNPKTNTRTISKISKLYEVSICPFPAYPQTSVEARSAIENGWALLEAKKQAKIKLNQILKRSV
jgi:HK97 family phage prohead protease